MTSPSTDTRCCNLCRGILGSCLNADCGCHTEQSRKEKVIAGAHDFAKRFEPVMRDLAKEETVGHTEPKEGWLDQFNVQFVVEGRLKGNHLIVKDFITETIAKEVEKERERIFQAIKAEARWHWQSRLTEMADWFDSLRPHKLK